MLAGSAPEEVSQVRSLLGPSGRLTQQGRVSEVERGNQAARLSEEIRTAHPGLANLSVLPAGDSEEILVEAPVDVGESVNRWRNKDPGGRSASVRQSLQPNMRAANTGWVVGGGQLNRPSGAAECTSAFTVLNAPAPPKLLTAGHCADDLRYGSYQWLQYASDRVGSYGDLQWHTIYNGGYALPQFQYAPGYLTTNKYSSSVYRNQMVNRYGRMTSETMIVNRPGRHRDHQRFDPHPRRRYRNGQQRRLRRQWRAMVGWRKWRRHGRWDSIKCYVHKHWRTGLLSSRRLHTCEQPSTHLAGPLLLCRVTIETSNANVLQKGSPPREAWGCTLGSRCLCMLGHRRGSYRPGRWGPGAD